MRDAPIIPMGEDASGDAEAASHRSATWQSGTRLSSAAGLAVVGGKLGDRAEAFLADAGFDRAPWLAVFFGAGIFAWFALHDAWQWAAAIGLAAFAAFAAICVWPFAVEDNNRGNLRQAIIACAIVFAAGVAVIWVRSEMVGASPIARPMIQQMEAYVLDREDQPAEERIRLTLAVRFAPEDQPDGGARKIRVNVREQQLGKGGIDAPIHEGAIIRLRARLMPPASPMLPGSYDFARAAWFKGLAATGSAIGPIELVQPAPTKPSIKALQRTLSAHVRARVDGSAGTIAAAFASGDRGAIDRRDAEAMRDAGLTHLLAISGLHVSAVIGAAYFVVIRLLALFPSLALRVRLPIVAAASAALAGIGYTLLTGAQVPTVRACAAAMLVLIAMALGRDVLSLRMVAVAAGFVLLLWPESAIGPSFQMSFSAVLAIVALSTSKPARSFMAPRDEAWLMRFGRGAVMLFATGLVIELALMPIVLFHFHRAGIYGALANLLAIPLVTFVSMPLIAVAMAFDLIGLGAPFWWLVETSLNLLLNLAHFTSSQPGAVKLMPQMTLANIALFVTGGLWIALWHGKARVLGVAPIAIAIAMLLSTPIPDILIGRDGRQVGITTIIDGERRLLSLRDSNSSYTRDNLLELAGVAAQPLPLADWPKARCSSAFCILSIPKNDRTWHVLMARTKDRIEERALAAACSQSDIVIADRYLPRSCKPRWLKADRRMLDETGGISINLDEQQITTVAAHQGNHGWWRASQANQNYSGNPRAPASPQNSDQ